MATSKPLRVGIIGPAGFGGSYLAVELLNRGHTVIGISRNPEKLGKHERYIPRSIDIDNVSISELAKAFDGMDVLVSEYGPHTQGAGALQYSEFPIKNYNRAKSDVSSALPRDSQENHISCQNVTSQILPLRRRRRLTTRPRNTRMLR